MCCETWMAHFLNPLTHQCTFLEKIEMFLFLKWKYHFWQTDNNMNISNNRIICFSMCFVCLQLGFWDVLYARQCHICRVFPWVPLSILWWPSPLTGNDTTQTIRQGNVEIIVCHLITDFMASITLSTMASV